MISRRNLLGAKGKQVILVDHNEKSQAVAGIESAEIMEIIDHHRLGTVQTMARCFSATSPWAVRPPSFTRCTRKPGDIEKNKTIAGTFCAAPLFQTRCLFRSPPAQRWIRWRPDGPGSHCRIHREIRKNVWGGQQPERESPMKRFFTRISKRFTVGKVCFRMGQDHLPERGRELENGEHRMPEFMEKAREKQDWIWIFFMLTKY